MLFSVPVCKHYWCMVMWFWSKTQPTNRIRRKYCRKEFYLYLYLNLVYNIIHPWMDNIHHLISVWCVHKNLHIFIVILQIAYLSFIFFGIEFLLHVSGLNNNKLTIIIVIIYLLLGTLACNVKDTLTIRVTCKNFPSAKDHTTLSFVSNNHSKKFFLGNLILY